jgi:hypothetical protein
LIPGILFDGADPEECDDACDFNDDGELDISDPVSGLNYLFVMGSPSPPAPFPSCGTDPTNDSLGCDTFAGCP